MAVKMVLLRLEYNQTQLLYTEYIDAFTSNDNGCGFFGRVAHVIAGHTAVDTGVLGGDGRQGESAVLHQTLLG